MKQVLIVVEGIADQVFLADFIAARYNSDIRVQRESKTVPQREGKEKEILNVYFEKGAILKGEIIASGGLDHLYTGDAVSVLNRYHTDYGADAVILFVFDSDKETIADRKADIIKKLNDKGVAATENKIFLFPNDNDGKLGAKNGDIESLLVQLFAEKYQPIEKCIDGYLSCLTQTTELTQIPTNQWDLKTKVYSYLAALLEIHKKRDNKTNKKTDYAHEHNRDYRQPFWNLYADAATPLKEFLDRHLIHPNQE